MTRWPLALIFLYAGMVKLLGLARFAHHVGDFGIVLDRLVKPVALAICLIELALGAGLLANRRGSLYAIVCLLACFVAVLVYGIAMGLDIKCGCLGVGYAMDLRWQLIVDFALLGWCLLVFWSCWTCESSR